MLGLDRWSKWWISIFRLKTADAAEANWGVVVLFLKLPHFHHALIKTKDKLAGKCNHFLVVVCLCASIKLRFSAASVQMHVMTDKSLVTWRRSISALAALL